jgi:hypothetical protein
MQIHSDQKWLWGVALAMPIAFATVSPLHVPIWVTVGLWSIYPVVVVFAVLSLLPAYRQLHSRKNERPLMGIALAMLIGAVVGSCSAAIIWTWQHSDEEDKPAVLPATSPVAGNVAVTPADELEFYFHPPFFGGGRKDLQYSATTTNRSPRKMHLELWAHIDYFKDNGEPARYGFQPEWNPNGLKENTGQTALDFEPFETKKGSLILFLPKPEASGIRQWNLNPSKNVYIHTFDSVTGKHIAFKVSPGYPDGKMPWPLPSHKELLAMEFPKAATSDSQELPALETLELLARTQFFGYRNDNSLSLSAVLTNRSSNRMKLQINLLTRKSMDDKEWRTFRGVIVPSREEKKNHLDYYALDFGPGDVADCSLVFANTGFKNKMGEELKESPTVSLLEIFDEVSGKKVWCAIEPGYPPGADLRSAAIQPPPAIPKSDSDNLQKDETNDSK